MNKQDWINPKIKIKKTADKGKGMFATKQIKKGEKILIWGGEYVDKKRANQAIRAGQLVMQWDDDLFSIETRGEDSGYFLNHSCDPNAWMADTFTVMARRQIETGEEITLDYALIEVDNKYQSKWTCRCGSPFCRKKITGKDWLKTDLQNRYKKHFLPVINKKIDALKKIN